MSFILFTLGIILGMLIRDIKCYSIEKLNEAKKSFEERGQAQFIEPESIEERLQKAKELKDFIR